MNSVIKHIISLLFFLSASVSVFAQSKTLYKQANEAYGLKKWKSASTLYYILLRDSTEYSPTYVKAVTAGILAGDSVSIDKSLKLIESQKDSLGRFLNNLASYSISTKQFEIFPEVISKFENFSTDQKKELTRAVVKYRELLRMPDETITLIDSLLVRSPQNPEWLVAKAKAYQLKGEIQPSLELYEKVLEFSPYHFQSLLFLGNYYYIEAKAKISDIESKYNKIEKKNPGQYSKYSKEMGDVKRDLLSKSEYYLERAEKVSSNDYLRKTLYDIYVLESDSEKANKLKKKMEN